MKLLIASALLLILSTVTVDGSAVYDITGEPLKSGSYYHITSAIRGAGGGGLFPLLRLQPCPRHIWGCSHNVAQHSSDLNRGRPATFYPLNSGEKIVQLDSEVNIEFNFTLPANEPATWQLEKADGSTGRRYVTIGGKPTPDNAENKRFKIEKAKGFVGGFAYNLLYCPSVPVPPSYVSTCLALGITFDNQGGRWLSTSPSDSDFRTFVAVFIKAESSGAIRLVTE